MQSSIAEYIEYLRFIEDNLWKPVLSKDQDIVFKSKYFADYVLGYDEKVPSRSEIEAMFAKMGINTNDYPNIYKDAIKNDCKARMPLF